MVKKQQLKIYGTRKRGHREKWFIKKEGKHRYREVRRDKKGHFISSRKWSWKNPIGEEVFTEVEPLIIDYEDTAKGRQEALREIRETVREWEWIKFEAES